MVRSLDSPGYYILPGALNIRFETRLRQRGIYHIGSLNVRQTRDKNGWVMTTEGGAREHLGCRAENRTVVCIILPTVASCGTSLRADLSLESSRHFYHSFISKCHHGSSRVESLHDQRSFYARSQPEVLTSRITTHDCPLLPSVCIQFQPIIYANLDIEIEDLFRCRVDTPKFGVIDR